MSFDLVFPLPWLTSHQTTVVDGPTPEDASSALSPATLVVTDSATDEDSDCPLEPRILATESIAEAETPTVADPLVTPESSPLRGDTTNGPKNARMDYPSSPSPTPDALPAMAEDTSTEDADDSGLWITQTGRSTRGLARNGKADQQTAGPSASRSTPPLMSAASRGEGRSGSGPVNRLFTSAMGSLGGQTLPRRPAASPPPSPPVVSSEVPAPRPPQHRPFPPLPVLPPVMGPPLRHEDLADRYKSTSAAVVPFEDTVGSTSDPVVNAQGLNEWYQTTSFDLSPFPDEVPGTINIHALMSMGRRGAFRDQSRR